MGSPFFRRAHAPYCQRMGATSDGVPLRRLWRSISARWHSSNRSSKICQNFSMSPPEDSATSGRLMVTTPWLKRP